MKNHPKNRPYAEGSALIADEEEHLDISSVFSFLPFFVPNGTKKGRN
jgi:hypothetical protein